MPKKKEVKVDKTQQESEAKVLAKREEYKESSKKRELASEERMKKNLVEQAKKANVEKEVAQLDKTTEKAMSKELWLGKSRVAKQGYFSLFAGGPRVSKKVYDEHLKGVINSYIEQVKKREEKSSTGLGDTKKYPDKKLLERLRDLELKNIDKKTEEVIAVSGNSDFTAEELGLRTIGNNREYYVVKVVNTHSKTKWR